MTDLKKIGVMQGRFTELVDGKIQAFPWKNWQSEFKIAANCGIELIEWTLDAENLNINPLMTEDGRSTILNLMKKYSISIPSLTGDCFMQSPFWKYSEKSSRKLKVDFLNICSACNKIGIEYIVVPLVDNGRIETIEQENNIIKFLNSNALCFSDLNLKIVFESDYPPKKLKKFIDNFEPETFGINYDIGNSASLGFNPREEFLNYGSRILNVHVKDRVLNGTTVALGMGDADFPLVFSLLNNESYNGNYILQTARADDGDHVAAITKYKVMVGDWLNY